MKRKLTIERKLTLVTEIEVKGVDDEALTARTNAMKQAITNRGLKALPPVTWDLASSSIRVVDVKDV